MKAILVLLAMVLMTNHTFASSLQLKTELAGLYKFESLEEVGRVSTFSLTLNKSLTAEQLRDFSEAEGATHVSQVYAATPRIFKQYKYVWTAFFEGLSFICFAAYFDNGGEGSACTILKETENAHKWDLYNSDYSNLLLGTLEKLN